METMLALLGVGPGPDAAARRGNELTAHQQRALESAPEIAAAADIMHKSCSGWGRRFLSNLQLFLGRSLEQSRGTRGITKAKWNQLSKLKLVPAQEVLKRLDGVALANDATAYTKVYPATSVLIVAYDNIGWKKIAGPGKTGYENWVSRLVIEITQAQLIQDGILLPREDGGYYSRPLFTEPEDARLREVAEPGEMALNQVEPTLTSNRLRERCRALLQMLPAILELVGTPEDQLEEAREWTLGTHDGAVLPVRLGGAGRAGGEGEGEGEGERARPPGCWGAAGPQGGGDTLTLNPEKEGALEAEADADEVAREAFDRYKDVQSDVPLPLDLASKETCRVLALLAQMLFRRTVRTDASAAAAGEGEGEGGGTSPPFLPMQHTGLFVASDGGPAYLMLDPEINTDKLVVCNGGFHWVLECIRMHARLFEATHLRRYYMLWRTIPQTDWMLDLSNPQPWVDESPEYIYAHIAAAAKHLKDENREKGRDRDPSADELYEYMCDRAAEMPAAGLVLMDLNLREAIHGLLDAEMTGPAGLPDYQKFSAVLAAHLIPLTNAYKYMELHLSHARWWHMATELQQVVYRTYCWVVKARSGRYIFRDRWFEKTVWDLRRFLGKTFFSGLRSAFRRVAAVLPALVRGRQEEAGGPPADGPGRAAHVALTGVFLETFKYSLKAQLWKRGAPLVTEAKRMEYGIGRGNKTSVPANASRHCRVDRADGELPVTMLGDKLAMDAGALAALSERRTGDFYSWHHMHRGGGADADAGEGAAAPRLPVCPPVFDGDYWPEECGRLGGLIERRRGLFGGNHALRSQTEGAPEHQLEGLVLALKAQPAAYPFNRPVDPEALGLRDYRTVCPQPMDLGTVAARLQAKRYATPDAVVADVRLVFRNASRYNPPGHPVHEAARTLLAHFERKLGALLERLVSTGAAESPDAWLAGYPLDRAAADAEDRAPSVRARLLPELAGSVHRMKESLFVLYLQDGRADASGAIRDPDAGLRLSCPLLDSRHTFLEMCQFWHYQFDSLRRAKHSTVMLLYHLHVPRAESLGISCAACAREIRRVRWHCATCVDFNICRACERERGAAHRHALTPFRITFSRRRALAPEPARIDRAAVAVDAEEEEDDDEEDDEDEDEDEDDEAEEEA